tara:strand:+ start:459 stop:725 length:267 start_codon:yes stop_codon:yes gene_type:complete
MDWLEILIVVLGVFSYIGQGLLVLFVITWIIDNRFKILEKLKLTWSLILRWTIGLISLSIVILWLSMFFYATFIAENYYCDDEMEICY